MTPDILECQSVLELSVELRSELVIGGRVVVYHERSVHVRSRIPLYSMPTPLGFRVPGVSSTRGRSTDGKIQDFDRMSCAVCECKEMRQSKLLSVITI